MLITCNRAKLDEIAAQFQGSKTFASLLAVRMYRRDRRDRRDSHFASETYNLTLRAIQAHPWTPFEIIQIFARACAARTKC